MSNRFDEHTWSREQCTLDESILREFEALEKSYAEAEVAGLEPAAWAKRNRDAIKPVVAEIANIEHDGRHKHWAEEFARLGISVPTRAAKPEPPTEVTEEEVKADGP